MADIKKIKLPRSSEAYNLVDDSALHSADIATSITSESTNAFVAGAKATWDLVKGLGDVLIFKGTQATPAAIKNLTNQKKGYVYLATSDGSEWVCTKDITAADSSAWEEFGHANTHKHTVTAAGTNDSSAVSGTFTSTDNYIKSVTAKKLSATASGTTVGASGSKNALGENATFTTTVTPATTNIKATASGVAVGANGTANAITGFGAHSTDNALGEGATFTTSVNASKSYIKATASGTTLSTVGATIKPIASLGTPTQVSLPTITDSTWSFSYANDTLIIGGGNSSHTAGSVTAGSAPTYGDEKTFLTSASVSAQPTVAISAGTSNDTGAFEVATGISSASTVVNEKDVVTAITALGTPTTAAALTGVKVTAQPTVSLATGAESGAGVISVATGITSSTTSVKTKDVVAAVTGVSVTAQPTITLAAGANGEVDVVASATPAKVTGSISGTAAGQTFHGASVDTSDNI